MKLQRLGTAVAGLFVVLPMLACAGRIQQAVKKAQEEVEKQARTQDELRKIHRAWSDYLTKNQGNAPSGPEDLDQYLGGPNSDPAKALRSGKYVFFWDVSVSDMITGRGGVPTAKVVLAYDANVPTNSGFVLMADGTVKHMSAGQFTMLGQPGGESKASDFKKAKK